MIELCKYDICKGLLEDSKTIQRHRYILLLLLLLLSPWFWLAWFKLGFNIHLGVILILNACWIISVHYLTFSLGTLTRSTQLTESNTVPKAMTTKINNGYIFSRYAEDQYCSLSFHQMVTVIEFQRLLLFFIDSDDYFYYEMIIFMAFQWIGVYE